MINPLNLLTMRTALTRALTSRFKMEPRSYSRAKYRNPLEIQPKTRQEQKMKERIQPVRRIKRL